MHVSFPVAGNVIIVDIMIMIDSVFFFNHRIYNICDEYNSPVTLINKCISNTIPLQFIQKKVLKKINTHIIWGHLAPKHPS